MSDSEESLINPPTPGRYPHNDDDYSPDSFDEFEPQATSTAVNKPVDYVEVQTIHGAEAEQDNAKGSEVHAAANDDSEVKKIDENVEGENDEDEEEETSDDVKEKKNVEDSVEVEKADVDDDKEYQKYLEWKRNQKKNLHKNRNSNMTDTSFTCPTAPEKDPRDDRVESLEDSEKGKDDCELIEEGKGEDIADRTEKDGEKRGAKRKGGDDDTGSVLKKSKTLVDVLDDANVVQKQKEDEMREFLEELDFGEQAEVKTVNRKLSLHHFLNMQLHGQLLRQVSSEKITDMSAKVCASIDGVKALFDVDLINSRPHILISEDCDEEHPEQGIVSDGNHRAIAVLNSCQHLLEQGDMEIDVVLVKLNPTNFASLFQLSRSLRPEDQRHADGVWNANKTNLSKVDSGTRRIIMKLYYDEVSRSKGAFSLYDNTVVLVEIFRGLIRDSDCIDLIRRSPSKRNAFYRKITELGLAPTASSSEGHIKEAFMLSVMRTLTRKVYLHHLSEGFNFWTADKSTEILLKASISNDKLTSEQLQNCVKKKMSGARVRQILQAIIAASKRQEENVNEAVETETHAPDVNVPFPLSSMATVVTTVSEVKNESCLVCIGQFPENILEVVKRRITVVVLDIHGSILNIDQKLAKYTNIGTVKRSAYCEGTGTAPYMICSLNLDKDKCVKFCKNTATTIVSIINKNTGHSKDKKKAFCEIFAVPKYCGSEDD